MEKIKWKLTVNILLITIQDIFLIKIISIWKAKEIIYKALIVIQGINHNFHLKKDLNYNFLKIINLSVNKSQTVDQKF